MGPHRILEATTVATFSPPYARANWIAARPGGSSAPEIMAANVSRMWCFAFSITSGGSVRFRASLMYVLTRVITGLAGSPAATTGIGNIAAAMTPPTFLNKLRRVRYLSFCIDLSSIVIRIVLNTVQCRRRIRVPQRVGLQPEITGYSSFLTFNFQLLRKGRLNISSGLIR